MAFNKLKEFLKKDEDVEDIIEEEEFYEVSKKNKNKDANLDSVGNKMILMEPRSFSESQAIADHLKKKNSVVVNLKRVTSVQAKRIIDFLGGCIYAINGKMEKIGVGIYLCAPKNVSVQGQITDDSEKGKNNVEDELEL